jgi:hypothetical protein
MKRTPDYSCEESRTTVGEYITYGTILLAYLTERIITFLPRKGLEKLASITTRRIAEVEGIENSEMD